MILGFKTKFPDGTPTNFVNLILQKEKKHSMRWGHRWRENMSIQMATGVRTKDYYQFNKEYHFIENGLQYCTGVQDVLFCFKPIIDTAVYIDGKEASDETIELLAKNDGFKDSGSMFNYFYLECKRKNKDKFIGQIVHWTDLRY